MMGERDERDFLRDLEDSSAEGAEDAPDEDEIDLVEAVRAGDEQAESERARDLTLGGYMEEHDRPTAFEGLDGQPYTVDVDVEETDDPRGPYVSFLVFVRWAATGGGIMEHVESGDIAHGQTAEEAKQGALDLSLYEVKAELDAAIERRQTELES